MNKFFRGIIAAWGAKKLGGGCLSTIIIFIVIYSLLGKCNNGTKAATKTNINIPAIKKGIPEKHNHYLDLNKQKF